MPESCLPGAVALLGRGGLELPGASHRAGGPRGRALGLRAEAAARGAAPRPRPRATGRARGAREARGPRVQRPSGGG